MLGRSARKLRYLVSARRRGAELMLAAHAAAPVLRPHGKQVARDGAGDVNRRDVAKGGVERLGQPHARNR